MFGVSLPLSPFLFTKVSLFPVGVSFINVNFYAGQVLPILMCLMYGVMIINIYWQKSRSSFQRKSTAFDVKLVSVCSLKMLFHIVKWLFRNTKKQKNSCLSMGTMRRFSGLPVPPRVPCPVPRIVPLLRHPQVWKWRGPGRHCHELHRSVRSAFPPTDHFSGVIDMALNPLILLIFNSNVRNATVVLFSCFRASKSRMSIATILPPVKTTYFWLTHVFKLIFQVFQSCFVNGFLMKMNNS